MRKRLLVLAATALACRAEQADPLEAPRDGKKLAEVYCGKKRIVSAVEVLLR